MTKQWTDTEMEARLVRYQDLRPCLNAFVDTYTPGSDQKENFTIIGPGVSESPKQHVHIAEPHGFNIGGARQPPGCVNSQHSHESEEVFIVHSGSWAFRLGDQAQDGEVMLAPGDCISVPVNVFRGFENVGDDEGYLLAVLGNDDPGHVLWAPDVFDKAAEYGLVLLENGNLVDTTVGEKVPDDVPVAARTSAAQVAAHRIMSADEIQGCVCTFAEQTESPVSTLGKGNSGVTEIALIGPANAFEGIGAGKIGRPHGFHLRRLDFAASSSLDFHSRSEAEVLYVYRGGLIMQWPGGELRMGEGDVLTVPVGLSHSYRNVENTPAVAYVVRGGDAPQAAHWDSDT